MTTPPTIVTAVTWIQRGVAAPEPQTVKLEPSTLKELLEGGAVETSDNDSATEEQEMEEESKKGARGSAPRQPPKVKDPNDKFDLAGYDKEKGTGPTMKGLAVFTSQLEDPHITKHDDSEDEVEKEDMKIRPDDNLAVVAKFEQDDATLVVYVYNATDGDFYVHHDYPLSAPILCMEPIGYDPGVDNRKGNLLGVGTMNPAIEIWDLDIINAVKPVVRLGEQPKSNRKKRDGSAQGHTDSVLSLAWNRESDHLLASGGADNTVVLWDLDAAKVGQVLPIFDGMIQTLDWQPNQASILLSGTRSGVIRLDDGREDDPVAQWSIGKNIEVEKVFWDRFNENKVFALCSDGKLRYLDVRQKDKFIFETEVHEEPGGFSQSSTAGLIATAGDEEVKIWRLENAERLNLVHTRPLHLGKLHAASFCPDASSILLLGGEKQRMVHLLDVARQPQVPDAFPTLGKAQELKIEPEDDDEPDIKMEQD